MKRLGLALALLCAPAGAALAYAPPATLMSGTPAHGAATDPVLAHIKLDRMSCTFTEEKHIALLARPLRSNGTIVFDRTKGISRTTLSPKRQQVVLTPTTLRLKSAGRSEEVPLDKSKDLRAFATVFPALLRGERKELEAAFELGAYRDADWWALTLTPKADSLKQLVKRVTVVGTKSELVSLQIIEASGDTTETKLAGIVQNGDVPDSEITAAFAP
ncbi:hypothetical protein BH11MYX1_BH11MYX1_58190 [soil metagenome]